MQTDESPAPEAPEAPTSELSIPMAALVGGIETLPIKPKARGWIHFYACVIAIVTGIVLVSVAWSLRSPKVGLATAIYSLTVLGVFGVSAAYHRVNWTSPTTRTWMKRLDHSMIFVFIAGSYTPFAMLAMPPSEGNLVLAIVWGGALAGVILKMCWPTAPRWVGVPLYLLLGWVAVGFFPTLLNGAGVAAVVLLIVGGALYSIGAILYAAKWPNPWPLHFGHHEFFHAATVIAATCHYIAVWFAVFA
ncbi:PAQR family membrane homeostasis protein TrhA [Mycobacteroides abscessus]|uniref:PAQR family membrane homeostasis protein TrhA n=1 Tax=Mycobacteroides abscessus TaxID=36809 RepID=UPI00232B1BA4|nr:hemolysin III family protein [Mycobacteroides abscessus]MDB2193382.1 hemolysin III family protein [Mycobacteroides abscessus subsp. abscessus]MDB2198477.1 hemolysin III family protein [Mycobacteroides abscessus subsp. abscessus]